MFKKYYNLTKPKVVLLIVFTAIVGMLLAGIETVPLSQVVAAIVGAGDAGVPHTAIRSGASSTRPLNAACIFNVSAHRVVS